MCPSRMASALQVHLNGMVQVPTSIISNMSLWRYLGPLNYHFERNPCYKISHLQASSVGTAITRDVIRQVK
jgi:hypothetical protein